MRVDMKAQVQGKMSTLWFQPQNARWHVVVNKAGRVRWGQYVKYLHVKEYGPLQSSSHKSGYNKGNLHEKQNQTLEFMFLKIMTRVQERDNSHAPIVGSHGPPQLEMQGSEGRGVNL